MGNFSSSENYPIRIEVPTIMLEPNENILIYNGLFLLKRGESEFLIHGQIYFQWFPSKGVFFEGDPVEGTDELFSFYNADNDFQVVVDGIIVGPGFIVNINNSVRGVINYAGRGDRTISVGKILFSVPNLRDIFGSGVRNLEGSSFHMGRLIFETDTFTINLDRRADYRKHRESIRRKGGFFLFYGGELVPKSGSITLEEAGKIFGCLNMFLSFLQGGRVSVYFQKGFYQGEIIWENFPAGFLDPYKDGTFSWIPYFIGEEISELWGSFFGLWNGKKEDDFLNTALHWYLEANNYSGFVEGSIVMAQNALELIYNWWIVEKKSMLGGRDAENISASNKIRLLLSQLNIEPAVPKAFSQLAAYRSNEQLDDGPEKIVQIRNAIVHSQKKKREDLRAISSQAKFESLRLSLFYIELALLKILDYKGKFVNRTKTGIEGREEVVPWAANINKT